MINKTITPYEPFTQDQIKNVFDTMNLVKPKPQIKDQIDKQVDEVIKNPPKNLMIEEQKKLNSLVKELKTKLTSVQYENIKLNAQIEVLNRTANFSNEQLNDLKKDKSRLEIINDTLIKNNKHYWLFTVIISLGSTLFGIILGHYL